MGMQEDYQALVAKQFKEWQAQAERFKETATNMQQQAQAQFQQNLEFWQQGQAKAWESLARLKEQNEGAWAEVRTHMEKAGAELRSAAEAMTRGLKP
jgi:hypothetical protein